MYTKSQLVRAAMTEVGLASYDFDLSTDQLAQAVARLDSMMAEWNGRGLRLGYPISSGPASVDLNADSNLPDWAWEAVLLNLGVRLAPSFGKLVSPDTKASARHALNTIMARAALPDEMKLATLPAGAGAKGETFTTPEAQPLSVGPDAGLDFN